MIALEKISHVCGAVCERFYSILFFSNNKNKTLKLNIAKKKKVYFIEVTFMVFDTNFYCFSKEKILSFVWCLSQKKLAKSHSQNLKVKPLSTSIKNVKAKNIISHPQMSYLT